MDKQRKRTKWEVENVKEGGERWIPFWPWLADLVEREFSSGRHEAVLIPEHPSCPNLACQYNFQAMTQLNLVTDELLRIRRDPPHQVDHPYFTNTAPDPKPFNLCVPPRPAAAAFFISSAAGGNGGGVSQPAIRSFSPTTAVAAARERAGSKQALPATKLAVAAAAAPKTGISWAEKFHQALALRQLAAPISSAASAAAGGGERVGLGFRIKRRGGVWKVSTIKPGGAAEANGRIRSGDVIVTLDGKALPANMLEISMLFCGPAGSVVTLCLYRDGVEMNEVLVRQRPGIAGGGGGGADLVDEKVKIPYHLKCPITSELFVDPVFCFVDSYTYERSVIEDWVRRHGTSPMTRESVALTDLRPNRMALEALQDFGAKHPSSLATAAPRK